LENKLSLCQLEYAFDVEPNRDGSDFAIYPRKNTLVNKRDQGYFMTLPKWWVAIQLRAGKKDKRTELSHSEPDLVIGANILKIITYSNGTKNLTANVKLKPTGQITIEMLSLCLRGEKYEAKGSEKFEDKAQEQIKVTPITITNPKSYIVFFDVPGESAINSEDVKIYALANNRDYYSGPFGIKFEASL
jgi:hypothetical protein